MKPLARTGSPEPIDRDGPFRQRLWTPWRMGYVGGAREEGCVFCTRVESHLDVHSLIVYRGAAMFVILNLYPYNTGHLMIVPNAHVQDPAALEPAALSEMADLVAATTTGMRRILACDGFNVGMNIGAAAGAGIADHLHQHVVPRWRGDANFMPIVGSTRVLPETLPATYARIRAEFAREASGASHATAVVFDRTREHVLLDGDALPSVTLTADVPVWRSLTDALGPALPDLQIAAWAGPERTADDGTHAPAMAYVAGTHGPAPGARRMVPLGDAVIPALPESERRLIGWARERLEPA